MGKNASAQDLTPSPRGGGALIARLAALLSSCALSLAFAGAVASVLGNDSTAAAARSNKGRIVRELDDVGSLAGSAAPSQTQRYFEGSATAALPALAAELSRTSRLRVIVGTQAVAAEIRDDTVVVARASTATRLILFARDPGTGVVYRRVSTPASGAVVSTAP